MIDVYQSQSVFVFYHLDKDKAKKTEAGLPHKPELIGKYSPNHLHLLITSIM